MKRLWNCKICLGECVLSLPSLSILWKFLWKTFFLRNDIYLSIHPFIHLPCSWYMGLVKMLFSESVWCHSGGNLWPLSSAWCSGWAFDPHTVMLPLWHFNITLSQTAQGLFFFFFESSSHVTWFSTFVLIWIGASHMVLQTFTVLPFPHPVFHLCQIHWKNKIPSVSKKKKKNQTQSPV